HMRSQLAFAVPAAELLDARSEALRLAPREVAPEDADDRCAFEKREIERQLGKLAGGEADDQEPAAPGERAERGLAVRPADRVVDHVDAAPLGERLDPLAQILDGIVDRRICAVLAAHGELLLARGAGDDARAERFCDLDRRQADAARRAEYEQHLAL